MFLNLKLYTHKKILDDFIWMKINGVEQYENRQKGNILPLISGDKN